MLGALISLFQATKQVGKLMGSCDVNNKDPFTVFFFVVQGKGEGKGLNCLVFAGAEEIKSYEEASGTI